MLQVDRYNESFFVSHLVFWLMGRYQKLQFGIHIQMEFQSKIQECLFKPVIMPSLSSQLVSLEVCSDASIWPGLFQLRALTRLCLTLVGNNADDAADIPSPPKERQLPKLEYLELTNCKASVSPLLDGAVLPALHVVRLLGCKVPGGINLSGISAISSLGEVTIDACNLQQVIGHASNLLLQ